MRVGKITANLQTREVKVVEDDWDTMNKRVTIVLSLLLVLSIAPSAPAFSVCGVSGPGEEKNIRLTITGEDCGEEEKHYIVVEDKDDVKVLTAGEGCGFIGINMEDLTEKAIKDLDYPQKAGVVITGVVEDSAAEKYGLQEEDIIYMFDGTKVLDSEQLAELVKVKKPGDEVEILFYRDGKKKKITLELGERKYDVYAMNWEKYGDAMKKYAQAAARAGTRFAMPEMRWFGMKGRLGLALRDLDEDLAPYFDVKAGEGVLVIDVVEDSPAEKAGIKSGDVIVEFGGESVSSAEDLVDEIYGCADEEKIELVLMRRGEKKNIDIEVGDEFKFMYMPHPNIKKIEIPESYNIEILGEEDMGLAEKKALQKEIEVLRKEIERMQKRLEKIEKK